MQVAYVYCMYMCIRRRAHLHDVTDYPQASESKKELSTPTYHYLCCWLHLKGCDYNLAPDGKGIATHCSQLVIVVVNVLLKQLHCVCA